MLSNEDKERAREVASFQGRSPWHAIAACKLVPKLLDEVNRLQSLNGALMIDSGALQAEVSRLEAKIAEFIDGENHHEQCPPAP